MLIPILMQCLTLGVQAIPVPPASELLHDGLSALAREMTQSGSRLGKSPLVSQASRLLDATQITDLLEPIQGQYQQFMGNYDKALKHSVINPSIGPMVPLDKLHAPISKPFELPKHGLNDDHAGQFPLSRAIFDNQHTSNLGDSRQIPNNRETSDLITELEHEAAVTASSRLKKKHKSQGRRRYTEEGGRRKEGAARYNMIRDMGMHQGLIGLIGGLETVSDKSLRLQLRKGVSTEALKQIQAQVRERLIKRLNEIFGSLEGALDHVPPNQKRLIKIVLYDVAHGTTTPLMKSQTAVS